MPALSPSECPEAPLATIPPDCSHDGKSIEVQRRYRVPRPGGAPPADDAQVILWRAQAPEPASASLPSRVRQSDSKCRACGQYSRIRYAESRLSRGRTRSFPDRSSTPLSEMTGEVKPEEW